MEYIIGKNIDGMAKYVPSTKLKTNDKIIVYFNKNEDEKETIAKVNTMDEMLKAKRNIYVNTEGTFLDWKIRKKLNKFGNDNFYQESEEKFVQNLAEILNKNIVCEELDKNSKNNELDETIIKIEELIQNDDIEGAIEYILINIDLIKDIVRFNIDLEKKIEEILVRENVENINGQKLRETLKILKMEREENKKNKKAVIDEKKENEKINKKLVEANKKIVELMNEKPSPKETTTKKVVALSEETKFVPLENKKGKYKAEKIIYFKELSYVNYLASLVEQIKNILEHIYNKNVKILIFDNYEYAGNIYSSATPIEIKDYTVNKSKYLKESILLFKEPNQVILEDLLKEETDYVIIYDKMKKTNDFITGNVNKFFISNTLNEILKLKDIYNIELDKVISRVGTNENGINISTIKDYPSKSTSAKEHAYYYLENVGSKKGRLFEMILGKGEI